MTGWEDTAPRSTLAMHELDIALGEGFIIDHMTGAHVGLLTIGEFADATGLSRKALRLYDDRGLLKPVSVDPENGYRRYSHEQVTDATVIAMLRAIGMPLADIETVLKADMAERSGVVGRYWYRIERDLDTHRAIVRELRGHSQEKENGMSYSYDALQRARIDGGFAAIASLAEVDDLSEAADAYRQAMKSAYWDEKDLALVSAIAYAGASRLLTAARSVDEDAAYETRSAVKALMYDLASFTWPGWDEPGVAISAESAAAGLSAARSNLAMAVALDKGDLPLSRGHWMLGGHLLTSGSPSEAREHFDLAADFADHAGADPEAALARAFAALADLALSKPDAESNLAVALKQLEASEDGEMFISQVETARIVCGLSPGE